MIVTKTKNKKVIVPCPRGKTWAGAVCSMAKDVPVEMGQRIVPNQDGYGSWIDPATGICLAFVGDGCGQDGAAVSACVQKHILELFQDAVAWRKGAHNGQELERLKGEGSAFRGKNIVTGGRLYDAEGRGGLNMSRLLGFKSLAASGLIPDPHVASFSLGSIGYIVLCTKVVVPAERQASGQIIETTADVGRIVAEGHASGQSIVATAKKIVEGARQRLRVGFGSAEMTERGFLLYDTTAAVFSVARGRAPHA